MGRFVRRLSLAAITASLIAVPAHGAEFGVNAQKLLFEQPPASWAMHFRGMAEAGMASARTDALWAVIEPAAPQDGRHRYHWESFDALVAGLARQRIRWLPVIGYSTRWTATRRRDHRSPPRHPRAYAQFAAAVARRYGRDGAFWQANPRLPYVPVTDYEIWNEPDYRSTFFPPKPYARTYLLTREAIRATDPAASVWIGGLAERAVPFVRAMYAAEPRLRGNVDAVGLHPYGEDLETPLRKTVALRRALDRLGEEDVPIAVTEIGWATRGEPRVPVAPDRVRAQRLALLAEVLALSDCGVEQLIPHTWVTLERNPRDPEHWFGLVRPDGRVTAAGRAYADAARRARRWLSEDATRIPLCGR